MAINLSNYVVSDLCLGKPPLNSLLLSEATIVDALSAIKCSQDNFISIWSCTHHNHNHNRNININHKISDNYEDELSCKCVGKICMVDIICFLCKEENLVSPSNALLLPISTIINQDYSLVKHVHPSTSLVEAIDLVLQGAQNLVVPIQTRNIKNPRRKHGPSFHNGSEYCWLTQEDVIQFILTRIGLFNPISNLSIEVLGIIQPDILTVDYHAPAQMALNVIALSLIEQSSVGVVDLDGFLIGEISPFTLCGCDLKIAAAVMTLSTGDLMSYIDWGGPPEETVKVIKEKLKEKKLDGFFEILLGDDNYSSSNTLTSSSSSDTLTSLSSSSSDDESMSLVSSPAKLGRFNRSWSYSARIVRKAEAIVCHPRSSLIAVMIQAIAHRVNYVWVMEDNCTVIGIVTFLDILRVFRDHIESIAEELRA